MHNLKWELKVGYVDLEINNAYRRWRRHSTCTCRYHWLRKEIIAGVGGALYGGDPGRVLPPPTQLGGIGERCKLLHQGLGRSPRIQPFLHLKNSKNYAKKQ